MLNSREVCSLKSSLTILWVRLRFVEVSNKTATSGCPAEGQRPVVDDGCRTKTPKMIKLLPSKLLLAETCSALWFLLHRFSPAGNSDAPLRYFDLSFHDLQFPRLIFTYFPCCC